MNVKIENLLLMWDETIPTLFLNLVNTSVSARGERELRTAMARIAENTELDTYFEYGYGKHHLWVKQKHGRQVRERTLDDC